MWRPKQIPIEDKIPQPKLVNPSEKEIIVLSEDEKKTAEILHKFQASTLNKDNEWGEVFHKMADLVPQLDSLMTNENMKASEIVAMAYHKAKLDGSNPELVKIVKNTLKLAK